MPLPTNRSEVRDGDEVLILDINLDKEIGPGDLYTRGLTEEQRREVLEAAAFGAISAFPADWFNDARVYLVTQTETQVTGS